jgi:outer membrane protein, heavy metal efflux system
MVVRALFYCVTLMMSYLTLGPTAAAQEKAPAAPQSQTTAISSGPGFVSLDSLLQQMLVSNPELQAARLRWEAMQKRPGQESALPDPTIRLGWAGAGAPYPGAGLGTEPTANLGVEVSQMFPFPGKRGLKGGIAYQEARAESFMFRETELSLVSRLKYAFYELQYLYDALDVLTRNRNLLGQLSKVAENRYSVGEATQQDLIKSQIEISLLETRTVDLERRKQSAIAEINSLLNREIGAGLERPEPVSATIPPLPSFDALERRAMESSPQLRAQRANVDRRQLGVDLSRREYYPDFEVMGGYFNMGSMKDMYEFRVQLNVPIFFARKQRLGVEEATVRLLEARRTYRSNEETLNYQLKDQHLAAESARKLMDLYSKLILPQASLALESSLNSYTTGKIDFLSVLSNFSAILENEMKYYETRAQLLKAISSLSQLTGESIY